jgi:hypothetical protein
MSVMFGIEQAGRDAFLAVLQFQDHVTAAPWPYGTPPDPDDVPFLEVALETSARILVTGNLKHFPSVPWARNCSATAVSVGEVPAIDEIGFNNHAGLLSPGSEKQMEVYLRYYADEDERKDWVRDSSDCDLPPHEDPPYNRDRLLPRPCHEHGPEALEWLRANPNPSLLATNRFSAPDEAVTFVEALYAAGATNVVIGNILMLPNDRWAPYADMLLVDLLADHAQRREVFDLVEKIGRRDEEDEPLIDCGQSTIRLWWD